MGISSKANKARLYRQIDVWIRLGKNRAAVYRCLEILQDKKYCVQSKDFFSLPLDPETIRASEQQFIELICEGPPEEANQLYDTLEEAIKQHDVDFAWAKELEK